MLNSMLMHSDPTLGGSKIADYCPFLQAQESGDCSITPAVLSDGTTRFSRYGEIYTPLSRCHTMDVIHRKFVVGNAVVRDYYIYFNYSPTLDVTHTYVIHLLNIVSR